MFSNFKFLCVFFFFMWHARAGGGVAHAGWLADPEGGRDRDVDADPVELSPREFAILECLMLPARAPPLASAAAETPDLGPDEDDGVFDQSPAYD